jgi:hypothetical protein
MSSSISYVTPIARLQKKVEKGWPWSAQPKSYSFILKKESVKVNTKPSIPSRL